MMSIFADFLDEIMEDFTVCGSSFKNCLANLDKILERSVQVNLILNWEKCHFMVTKDIVLGHMVSERDIEVDKAKIEVIENLQHQEQIGKSEVSLDMPVFIDALSKIFLKSLNL